MHGLISVILLAGGIGNRMQSAIPKQFLQLQDKPIIQHSFDVFASHPRVSEIIIVCPPAYRTQFSTACMKKVEFALPGIRRQDSVYNGLHAISLQNPLVCIHDAARPFITKELVERVAESAEIHGAATAAKPLKFTVKESNNNNQVISTPDRSMLWEVQTPQIIRLSLLQQGFAYVDEHKITVTDDVSLVELIGHPVQLVEGCYRNIKITTPEDLQICQVLSSELRKVDAF